MRNSRLHVVPYYSLTGLLLWGREVLTYRSCILSVPPCLLLVSRQNIRISDGQIGDDTGFCSMPTGVMPTLLLRWGGLFVSRSTFFLTGSYSLCLVTFDPVTKWVFTLKGIWILSCTWRQLPPSLSSPSTLLSRLQVLGFFRWSLLPYSIFCDSKRWSQDFLAYFFGGLISFWTFLMEPTSEWRF